MTPTQTPIDLAALDQATGRFLRLALGQKMDPSAAVAILTQLHEPTAAFSPEQERQRAIGGQLTRNVVAVGKEMGA